MPQLLQHIDAIARQKQRDVLFGAFHYDNPDLTDYENLPCRVELIAWLDANAIAWAPCGDIADPDCMRPYKGQLYFDVPFDEADAQYRLLAQHLEHPDGTGRIDGLRFCFVPLDIAMKNAHHDAPGYWESWAEDF